MKLTSQTRLVELMQSRGKEQMRKLNRNENVYLVAHDTWPHVESCDTTM